MSKTRLFLAFVFASALLVPAANAGTFTFGLTAGASLPMGDYGDVAKTGWDGGVFGDYWVTNQFGIGADVVYNSSKFDADGTPLEDESVNMIQMGGHLKWMFPMTGSAMAPWLQAGAGAYNVGSSVEGSDSETKFGFNLGAGLNFWGNDMMSLGLAGTYHNVMDAMTDSDGDETSASYINVGLNLTFSTTGTSSMGSK